MLILTNKNILYKGNKFSTSSKKINKLLLLTDSTFLGVSHKGVYRYNLSGDSLQDTGHFYKNLNIKDCYTDDNKLIITSDIGVLKISPDSMRKLNWLFFQNKINLKLYLLLFLGGFTSIMVIIYQYSQRRAHLKNKFLQTKNILKKLEKHAEKLGPETSEVYLRIKKEFNTLLTNRIKNNRKLNSLHNQIFSLIIIKVITKQKKQLREINTSESLTLSLTTENTLGSGNIFLLTEIILSNHQWITEYKKIKKDIKFILGKLQDGLLINGVTDKLLYELQSIKRDLPDLCLENIKQRKNELLNIFYGTDSSQESIILIKNEIQNLLDLLDEYGLFEKNTTHIKNYLKESYLSPNYSHTIWELLYNLKLIKKQTEILSILKEINILCLEYRKNIDYINKENRLEVDKKIFKDLYAEVNQKNIEIARVINELLYFFFTCLSQTELNLITDILKINNFESQNAKILVLLLADKKIKRTIIPGILDVYSNLNPIISRLINDRIKYNKTSIDEFEKMHPFSVTASLIFNLSK